MILIATLLKVWRRRARSRREQKEEGPKIGDIGFVPTRSASQDQSNGSVPFDKVVVGEDGSPGNEAKAAAEVPIHAEAGTPEAAKITQHPSI